MIESREEFDFPQDLVDVVGNVSLVLARFDFDYFQSIASIISLVFNLVNGRKTPRSNFP